MVLAIAVAAAILALGGQLPSSQPRPAITSISTGSVPPSASPTATDQASVPLAAGLYYGPTLQVADIVASMNADAKLTPADRTWIIGELVGNRAGTTLRDSIDLSFGDFLEIRRVGGLYGPSSSGRYLFQDDHTLVFIERTDASDVTVFDLMVAPDGKSFTLHRASEAIDAAHEFLTRTIFESGPYTLVVLSPS
jgi:hypothetical protein